MNQRPDSAQIMSILGALGGYVAANYDRVSAAACALVGLGYTVWKWRKDAAKARATRR